MTKHLALVSPLDDIDDPGPIEPDEFIGYGHDEPAAPPAPIAPSWDLARLKGELERDRERTTRSIVARGGEPERIPHLQISLREVAVKAIMAQHECDRATAFSVLAEAERERLALEENPTEARRREAAHRAELESRRLVRAVSDAGVPVRPEVVTALINGTGLVTGPAQDVHRWLGGPRRVTALLGDMGTGKTVAACAAVLAALRAHQTVAYVRETDVVRWSKSGALASEEKLERLRTVALLVIDELDQALAADAEQAGIAIAQLVDARVRFGRTVLVGNLTPDAFVRRYGRRCADRIREIGEIHDYRLAAGARSMRSATDHTDEDR